jgi:integrase
VLDQLRLLLRVRHYSRGTEDCYLQWARRFILFHQMRHPRTMGAVEVEQFLGNLATQGRVSASTQNQAFNAILFFYREVLQIDLGQIRTVCARRGKRLPVVLGPEEVRRVLDKIAGANGLFSLMARLLYGCGLRVHECCKRAGAGPRRLGSPASMADRTFVTSFIDRTTPACTGYSWHFTRLPSH